MKKHLSDRFWVIAILFILVVEVGWLLVDLKWIEISFLKSKSAKSVSKEAGYVIKRKDELKKREANSLIWENLNEKDVLYYQDSILTLSQSTAKLYLNDQTELQLSENTLITIEEQKDQSKSDIRLRFSKGDLKARNPFSKTQIAGDDWVVDLEKGSEIALRKDQDSFEFEVISGNAKLQTEKGETQLNSTQVLKLGENSEVNAIEKSQSLQWKDKKPIRIYVFDDKADVDLNWTGEAKQIAIQKAGEAETLQSVSNRQENSKVRLELGSYKLRLTDEKGISEARDVEVWRAPRIFLKKPLPRDRLPAGEPVEFVWTNETGIKSYRIKFSKNQKEVKVDQLGENFKTLQFDQDQDLEWQVEGIDEEGFAVPSFYQNQIFIREEPLSAPKLKEPSIRESNESKPGASVLPYRSWPQILFEFFVNKAQASQRYEILFDWEAVPGADIYYLEVSSTSDFRNPELIKTVKTNSFVWQTAAYKNYFWRVASGTVKGRMGLFSEAMEIKIEKLKKVENKVEAVKSEVVKVESPTPVVVEPEVDTKTKTTTSTAGWGFAYAPEYKIASVQGEQNAKIKLVGAVPMSARAFFQTPQFGTKFFQIKLRYSSQTWKPTPESSYPFQNKLNIPDAGLSLIYGQTNSNWKYGLSMHQSFYPVRQAAEEVSFKLVSAVGPTILRTFNSDNSYHHVLVGAAVHVATDFNELNLEAEYKYYFFGPTATTKFYLGASTNLIKQKLKSEEGSVSQFNLLLGFDRF